MMHASRGMWLGRRRALVVGTVLGAILASSALSPPAQAADDSIVAAAECAANTLPRNDDNSTSLIGLPFSVDFYGETYSSLYVNNNGNVSFGSPMSTYTPFGLADASMPIIAPFFADVDTGGSGSTPVQYGYGETIYEGHAAFCVNWVNVGYFSNHFDKLNSFQLLLVSRSDKGAGAFDIVFNYDRISWETGDASGGSNGFGGVSARAGFTSGTGQPGSVTEFSGSGRPGAFLDTAENGLTHGKLGSTVPGRYVFAVRTGGALVNKYVALGDSYQSGEGTKDYITGTDIEGVNQCHRSESAYPGLLVSSQVVQLTLDFRACSGAKIADMLQDSDPTGPPWNDGSSQISGLDPTTRLVTVGIVGNDLGFSDFVAECVKLSTFTFDSCEDKLGTDLEDQLTSLESGTIHQDLVDLYRLIRAKAPYARVVVVSYPHFFPEKGARKSCGWIFRSSDQMWMNAGVDRADAAIGTAARMAGFEHVNTATSNAGHEMCTDEEAMNGVKGAIWAADSESYHPNKLGHQLIADRIDDQLGIVDPTIAILPQQTISKKFTVQGKDFTVNVGWPGSDVKTTLISPSGVVYSRDAPHGADHGTGPTSEYYQVTDPEPGEWTVELYGLDVAENGEPVTLDAYDEQPINKLPSAAITVTGSGDTFTFDASRSTDSDGRVTAYTWDFGDGESIDGQRVTHTFTEPGKYRASLVVTDDKGGQGFGIANTAVEPSHAAVTSHSTTTLTNQLNIAKGDVSIDGDVNCNSDVHIAGALTATGKVYLTNNCTIDGKVIAGGTVSMDSLAKVGGAVIAGGDVKMQSTARVAGDITATGAFISIDGKTASYLKSAGIVGGLIAENATAAAVSIPSREVATYDASEWPGFAPTTWANWMNSTARANSAPSWSPALTSTPGCTMASWNSSVNGIRTTVPGNTLIDGRKSATNCAAIKLQGMTVDLKGDLTVYADSFETVNGARFVSADGAAHLVSIVVPGASACSSANSIKFSANTNTDDLVSLVLKTPGRVTINGTATLNAVVDSGCFAMSGKVTVKNG
ncbi:PKD domain-containing protein [Cryobacterium sp. PH31-AA6]|uniref:nidogen-like domain-containing protein n=1 Tax=Cryobacterium sp. PH31-AA6 TaxID=3046205 RepID=UPI0024BAD8F7|nr:nidogen-like domain-containing protein [Cryobacterium sp. PH31-AA6]MDJ0325353.1 PKD domain-containing protein [Cryobacterium sp. PH31-AA6]